MVPAGVSVEAPLAGGDTRFWISNHAGASGNGARVLQSVEPATRARTGQEETQKYFGMDVHRKASAAPQSSSSSEDRGE